MLLTNIAAPFPLQTRLEKYEPRAGSTHYLFALIISMASSKVSAVMTLRTGPNISFLLAVSGPSTGPNS